MVQHPPRIDTESPEVRPQRHHNHAKEATGRAPYPIHGKQQVGPNLCQGLTGEQILRSRDPANKIVGSSYFMGHRRHPTTPSVVMDSAVMDGVDQALMSLDKPGHPSDSCKRW